MRSSGFRALVFFLLLTVVLRADAVRVEVHADRVTGKLRPIWNNFGADEALVTLTPEGRHLLSELNRLSDEPIRIRVHHLLTSGDGTLALKWSSTNVYSEDAQGNPVYDWSKMDQIMDELTRPGLEPFVQAGFMPEALSSRPSPYTPKLVKVGTPGNMLAGGAFYPPKDYRKWEGLIEAWARHCAARYGAGQASRWLWELWNEPESPYFKGTPEEYFRLYDHFAAGVKRALPHARVGGPHVTSPSWKHGDVFMRAFLEHCRSGSNAATGGKGAPLDFVAFHAKGTTRIDEQGRLEMNIRAHLETIDIYAKIIASFPEFARLPVFIGESDPEGCAACPVIDAPERGYRLTSQYAAYSAATFMREQDLAERNGMDLQGAVTWAFTFAEQPWFNGLRELTTNKIALPVFNAFKLFAKLGPDRLALDCPSILSLDEIIAHGVRKESDVGAMATRASDRVTILLWNYHDVAGAEMEPRQVELTIDGLASEFRGGLAVREYAIDAVSGNSYSKWRALNSPAAPSGAQISALADAAEMRPELRDVEPSSDGRLQLTVLLPPQSVKLIEIATRSR